MYLQATTKISFFETKGDKKAAQKLLKEGEKSLEKFEKEAKEQGITLKTKVALTESISDWVLDYLSSHTVDLLIIDHPHLSEFEETTYTDIINSIHHEAKVPLLLLR